MKRILTTLCFSITKLLTALATYAIIFQISPAARPIRISFLQDAESLQDTLGVLADNGCDDSNVTAFRQVVGHYYEVPFDFDFGKFPKPTNGFYSFTSTQELVTALPHHLSKTKHPFDFNCMDMVILVAGDHLQTRWKPDDIVGPLMVTVPTTNGESVSCFATPRDAFTYGYAAAYREASEAFIPKERQDARICLTSSLYGLYILPMSTTDDSAQSTALKVMRTTWQRETVQFPTQFEVVLIHAGAAPPMIATEHAGLLFHLKTGYMYVEKAGGMGPFVRIDVTDKSDLLPWWSAAFVNHIDPSRHCFATFNADSVEKLNPK